MSAIIDVPVSTVVAVAITSTAVVAANTQRQYLLLVNDSDTDIYLKLGEAAVVNQGIRLNANGGNFEMSSLVGNLYQGAINGIHAGAATKKLLVTEGT